MGPMRELRLRWKIRWCGLVVSGIGSKNERYRRGVRPILFPQSQQLSSRRLPNAHARRLIGSFRNWRKQLLELCVERRLEIRIQRYENVVSCGGRRGILRG